MALIGSHCSIAGGMSTSLEEAKDLRCEAIQVFVKSNRQWAMRDLRAGERDEFLAGREKAGGLRVVAHGTYLVNLAATDKANLKKSRDTFVAELRRCAELEIESLVFHPGAHLGAGRDKGMARVATSLREALKRTDGSSVRILLENAAGQGTTLGVSFAELATMMKGAGDHPRLGICFDTCHAFAAGYDLTTDEGVETCLEELDRDVGLDRLGAVHLNDSKLSCGSRKDRHENLGKGAMGKAVFRRLMRDPRLADVPMLLETPGGTDGYRSDLRILRRLRRKG
ncbi:MAG: deoxyribonuclease IV [Planctomycetota bacterium]